MSNLSFIGKYKDMVIKLLLQNDNIVKLINPILPEEYEGILDINDVLLGGSWNIGDKMHYEKGHIFDYNFVEDRTDDVGTYIFVDVVVNNVLQEIFTDFKLIVCVFSHKSIIRLDRNTVPTKAEMQVKGFNGNRIDMLCDAIDQTLNGNSNYGIGHLTPSTSGHMSPYMPNSRYYGKCLSYTVKNFYDGSRGNCE